MPCRLLSAFSHADALDTVPPQLYNNPTAVPDAYKLRFLGGRSELLEQRVVNLIESASDVCGGNRGGRGQDGRAKSWKREIIVIRVSERWGRGSGIRLLHRARKSTT